MALQHKGFLIPNAGDPGVHPRMAEPDRVDFNTLAHPLWGVIDNCEVVVAGTTAQVTVGGTVLVNGKLVTLNPMSVPLTVSSTQDSFNLVVVDQGGTLRVIEGAPAVDPVFPDPPLETTVLAAVFCPAGAGNLSTNVVDKRKFVNKALLTKIGVGEALVRNLNGTGNHYLVNGDGETTWENDTRLWRSAPEELSVHRHLKVGGTLTGVNVVATGDIAAAGLVTGSNLKNTITEPAASPGTIWQNPNDGKVYVRRSGAWQEMATIQSANPPGTVITSFEKPDVMRLLGWLPLDGHTTVYESVTPSLFSVSGLAHLIQTTPGGDRYIVLPNATKRVLVTDFNDEAGTVRGPNPGNKVALQTQHMARHGHKPQSTARGAASPTVTLSRHEGHTHGMAFGGQHVHKAVDRGHKHHGFEYGGLEGGNLIGLVWGGQNKIDALFNDRNHTYSVEAVEWIATGYADIEIDTHDSEHYHVNQPDGVHSHQATVTGIDAHDHPITETEVGSSTPFDITPEYLVVYSYVRT